MDNVDDHIQCGLLHNILLINYANISLPIMFMWCAYVKKQLDMKGCQLIDVMKLDPFLLIFDTWWQTMRNHLFFLPKHNKCFLITKNKTLGLENCVAQGILYSSCYNRHKCQLHGTGWQCIHLVEHVFDNTTLLMHSTYCWGQKNVYKGVWYFEWRYYIQKKEQSSIKTLTMVLKTIYNNNIMFWILFIAYASTLLKLVVCLSILMWTMLCI